MAHRELTPDIQGGLHQLVGSLASLQLRSARSLGHRTWRRLFLAANLPAQRLGGATGVLTVEPVVMGGEPGETKGNQGEPARILIAELGSFGSLVMEVVGNSGGGA